MRRTLAAALLAAVLIPGQAQALENEELLALVAMPLAVAAVSEMTDVPMNDLIDVVTLMNDADVPPAQFVEVVRYAPVALIVDDVQQPRFSEFVRVQYVAGLRGPALVNSIEERIQLYGVNGVDLDVTAPRLVDIDDDFIPAVVRTRIAERRSHPHGGPPGQLKKQMGVQTGAEIVHGTKPGKKRNRADDRVVPVIVDDDRVVTKPRKVRVDDDGDNRGRGKKQVRVDDGDRGKGRGNVAKRSGNHGRGHGGSGDHGGGGKGKGKGKG